MTVRKAAQDLSVSAAEISGAIARVVCDVRCGVGSEIVVVDVDNLAENDFEREWREARCACAAEK